MDGCFLKALFPNITKLSVQCYDPFQKDIHRLLSLWGPKIEDFCFEPNTVSLARPSEMMRTTIHVLFEMPNLRHLTVYRLTQPILGSLDILPFFERLESFTCFNSDFDLLTVFREVSFFN